MHEEKTDVFFNTYVSTSWKYDVAERFAQGKGMIIKLDISATTDIFWMDVSWISKFEDECEILVARSVKYLQHFPFQCVVVDNSNVFQLCELIDVGETLAPHFDHMIEVAKYIRDTLTPAKQSMELLFNSMKQRYGTSCFRDKLKWLQSCCQSAKNPSLAKQRFQELIERFPDFVSYYYHAYYYVTIYEFGIAESSIEKMEAIIDKNAKLQQRAILLVKGELLYAKGFTIGAVKKFKKALTSFDTISDEDGYDLDIGVLKHAEQVIDINKTIDSLNEDNQPSSHLYKQIEDYLQENE
eukprot:459497_1